MISQNILKTISRYNLDGFVAELPAMPEVRFYHICAALPGTGVRPDSTLSFLMLPNPGTDCGWRSEWKRISEFPFYSADT